MTLQSNNIKYISTTTWQHPCNPMLHDYKTRSRRHFQILRDRVGQYLLHDVGSTTGTFLMIREELALDDQMIIQLFGCEYLQARFVCFRCASVNFGNARKIRTPNHHVFCHFRGFPIRQLWRRTCQNLTVVTRR